MNGYKSPELNSIQKDMWRWHEKDREEIGKLAGKDPIVYIGMGDEHQGGIFKDDLSEGSMSSQIQISYYNMQPWLNMPQVKAVYFTRGTPVHLWGAGDSETMLTHMLKLEHPKKHITMSQHWELDISGCIVDIAHHGPNAGGREWTRGNGLRNYTFSLMQKLHNNRERIPNLLLRAHFHQPISEVVTLNTDKERYRTEAWITPPQCFIGAHGQKATGSISSMHIGMLAFEIINGKIYDTHEYLHTVSLRTKESVEKWKKN